MLVVLSMVPGALSQDACLRPQLSTRFGCSVLVSHAERIGLMLIPKSASSTLRALFSKTFDGIKKLVACHKVPPE